MTTTAKNADPINPPQGYPEDHWIEDSRSPFFVSAELRAAYAKVPATPDDFSKQPRSPNIRYSTWAHQVRLRQADTQRFVERERVAYDAAKITCPVCGHRTDPLTEARTIRWGWSSDQDLADSGNASLPRVCWRCEQPVIDALRGRDLLPDGRTRTQAATEFADRWAHRNDAAIY